MNYFLTRPLLLLCRLVKLTDRKLVDGKLISIHRFERFKPLGVLVQFFHFIDSFMRYMRVIAIPLLLTDTIIVADRYVYDIVIDHKIELPENSGVLRLLNRLFTCLIPKDSIFFLIDTPKDMIDKRRPDVRRFDEDFDTRFNYYNELKQNSRFEVIDNSGELNKVIDDLLRMYFSPKAQ